MTLNGNLVVLGVCVLRGGLEDVNGPDRVVDNTGNVETLVLLSEGVDLGDFFGREVDVGEVLDDT